MIRKYSELYRLKTFGERFNYLSLRGVPFDPTFGQDRWVNQQFYRSLEWRNVREYVILRDNGYDLGIPGHEIFGDLRIHHMNPMSVNDIIHGEQWIIDPEYLITTSLKTHNAIHFGDESHLPREPIIRQPGDTRLWRVK
jgi:hypothetical protein